MLKRNAPSEFNRGIKSRQKPPVFGRIWRLLHSYLFMILAWAFDFRSEGAGAGLAIQSIFIGLYFLSFFVFILNVKRFSYFDLFYIVMFSILFVFVGVFSGIDQGQEVYGVIRNAITIFIFTSSAFATYVVLVETQFYTSLIRKMISYTVFLYMMATFLIVQLFQGGVDVNTSRYEIIGASVLFGLSYLVILIRFRLSKIEILNALVVVAVIGLSVTRTWIAVFALQAVVMVLLGGGLSTKALRRLSGPAMLLVITVLVMQFSGAPVIERWSDRLFASERTGVDPTALTRERQIESMIDSINQRPLFGNGLYGQSSYWLEKELGGDSGIEVSNGFGHNQHLGMIFVAGFLGGGPLLLWQLWSGIRALFFIYRCRRASDLNDVVFLGTLGSLVVIGTLVYGQFGGTFGSRGFTLWYGVGTGLLLASRRLLMCRPLEEVQRWRERGNP